MALAGLCGDDQTVKVVRADATAGFLAAKLGAGPGISPVVPNPGGNEQIEIIDLGIGGTPHDQQFSPANGQTVFTLAAAPVAPSTVGFYVNGVKYQFTTDFTVAANVVTWLNTDFTMAVGDNVDVAYVT